METRTIEVPTPHGPMALFEAAPSGPARGAVLVIQEAFGVNAHIEDVTRRFANEGYHAVAPHLFHRAGGGTASYDDFAQVFPLFEGLSDDGILIDIDVVLDHLHGAGFADGDVGVVGFCIGGRWSFLAALERALGASIGFYGGGIVTQRFPQFPSLIERSGELQTPWLGLFGDRDESIPAEDVEALRAALAGAPVEAEVVRYPDAEHGFHCDARPSYHESSARDAWARTLAWFERFLSVLA